MAWTLSNEDCFVAMSRLPDLSVDHVIVDPPFSEHVHENQARVKLVGTGTTLDLGFACISMEQIDKCAEQFARLARRWILTFSDAESIHLWRQAFERHGLEHIRHGAWVKDRTTPQITGDRPGTGMEMITIAHRPGRKKWNGGGLPAIWHDPPAANKGRIHPTEKPLSLLSKLIDQFTDPGETILDPFAGSASCGVAAISAGRSFIGFELDEKHFKKGLARLKATREQILLPLAKIKTAKNEELKL